MSEFWDEQTVIGEVARRAQQNCGVADETEGQAVRRHPHLVSEPQQRRAVAAGQRNQRAGRAV